MSARTDEPRVTLFCPSYNHEAYVVDTLESIVAQTWNNLEVIVIDDASTDSTPERVEEFCRRHPGKIRFRRGRTNRGTAGRWNEMIGMLSGEFLVSVGSDDLLPPGAIRSRVEWMLRRPDVSFLLTRFDVLTGNERLLTGEAVLDVVPQFEKMFRPGVFDRLYEELLEGNFVHPGAACYRLAALDRASLLLDERCPNLHDYAQMLEIARRFRVGFSEDSTYVYRWHLKNASASENPEKDVEAVTAEMNYILAKEILSTPGAPGRTALLPWAANALHGLKLLAERRAAAHAGTA